MARRRVFKTTHARHDPAICLAPSLFRNFKRGERRPQKLDIIYEYGGETIRFAGPEPLTAADLRFLQTIVALSAVQKDPLLNAQPKTDIGRQLRLLLDLRLEAAGKDALVVQESLQRILWEAGLSAGGENIKALKASLKRMANVTVTVTQKGHEESFRLLSCIFGKTNEKLLIALNPRITESVLGRRPHARIEMPEVRALRTNAARLIHQKLCGWIDPGKSGRVTIDVLCEYAWPGATSAAAMRKRQSRTRRALSELQAFEWTITEYAKKKFEIARPSKPKASATFPDRVVSATRPPQNHVVSVTKPRSISHKTT